MMLQRSALALVAVALVSGTAVAADNIANEKTAAEATLFGYLTEGGQALSKANEKLKSIKDPKSKEAQAQAATRDGIQNNNTSLTTLKNGLAQAKTSAEIIAIINQAKSIAKANQGLMASVYDPNKKKANREIYGGKRPNRMMKEFVPEAPGSEAAAGTSDEPESGGSFGTENKGGGSTASGGGTASVESSPGETGDSDLGGFALSDTSTSGESGTRSSGSGGNLFGSNSPADSGQSDSSTAGSGDGRQQNGQQTNTQKPDDKFQTVCSFEANAASPGAPPIKVCRQVKVD